MIHRKLYFSITLIIFWAQLSAQPVHHYISDFSLQSTEGRSVSLSEFEKAKGFIIVFTCNHCPFAQLYTQRFNDLFSRYSSNGVYFLAVNSMDSLIYEDETLDQMKLKAKTDSFLFPYLQDPDQLVGKMFGAAATPQVFLVWIENGKYRIRYSGAIDDNGEHPEEAHSFICAAVDAMLKGSEVEVAETKSFGCRIHYRK